MELSLIKALSFTEVSVCILVAGLFSMVIGAPFIYYNLRKARILVTIAMFHFLASYTIQVGFQLVSLTKINIRMSLWILMSSSFLFGVLGGLLGWFIASSEKIFIGLAAGWDIWLTFSCLIPIPAISSISGLTLGGILGYMSFTYMTSFEIVCASLVANVLLFHGMYLIGLGSIGLASSSPVLLAAYQTCASLACLTLTLIGFLFTAFHHYRAYRIHKDCFREERKPKFEATRLYLQASSKTEL